jgi:diguanylate cyclase (GGDEF)-like protein
VAIKETAVRLQVLFANVDLVSRFGGDEFCIFVWDIPRFKLMDKLERLLKILRKSYTDGRLSVETTASVGAVYCNNEAIDFATMLGAADKALYEAKENGRDQYILKEM